MSLTRWTCLVAAGFLSTQSVTAAGTVDPLFGADDMLEIRLDLPLATLKNNRDSENELGATIQYQDEAGASVVVDVEVRARGRYRRRDDVCTVPPMRLNFKTSAMRNTVFEKQDKLKLVTHCKGTDRYTQAVIREYLTYRLLNVLTDDSYRVRLLRITYVDTGADSDEEVHYGFLIENKDRLAKRRGKDVIEIPKTTVAALQADYSNMISLFHFMIGNTDYSQILGPPDEPCCHNHVLFAEEGQPIYSIPYDFDQSGIVNALYALPNPRFRLRNVKQRLYRGRCVNNNQLPKSIEHFLAKKDEILGLVSEHPVLSRSSKKQASTYLEDFYKVIESDKRIQRSLIKKCL